MPVQPHGYSHHPLHDPQRVWTETNCSLDVWVEVLHSLGLDPVPATSCAFSADFLGDQWTLLKFSLDDLSNLYGLLVNELIAWRPLSEHVSEHLEAGRLLTIEVDAWFLPNTVGRSYRTAHGKSMIVPNVINRAARRLEYFHNDGYWELSGDDYDGILREGQWTNPTALAPYVEVVRLGRRVEGPVPIERAVAAALVHIARRPPDNPVARMRIQLVQDSTPVDGMAARHFHDYAFATVRQCGATAELASRFLEWAAAHGWPELDRPAYNFANVAVACKRVQLKLSRLTRGRSAVIDLDLETMSQDWADGMAAVADWEAQHGSGRGHAH